MRDLLIEVFKKNLMLGHDFRSASGSLSEKDTLFFVFSENGKRNFAYEAALSPSLGESVSDVCNWFAGGYSEQQVRRDCATYRKAFSFAHKFSELDFSLEQFFGCKPKQSEFLASTIGIGGCTDTCSASHPTLSRLKKFKGSKDNLDFLISTIGMIETSWIVDFNKSLNESEWIRFCGEADFSKAVFVEQPLAVGVMRNGLAGKCPVPVFADEELNFSTPQMCADMGFAGFLLKTVRHSASEIMEYTRFARKNGLQFTFGTMLCDAVDNSFAEVLSRFSDLSWSSGESSGNQVFEIGEHGKLMVHHVALDEVLLGSELVYSSRV